MYDILGIVCVGRPLTCAKLRWFLRAVAHSSPDAQSQGLTFSSNFVVQIIKHVFLRENTRKKKYFFSGLTTKFLPPPPNGLVVHATFFFLVLEYPETDFDNFFPPNLAQVGWGAQKK